MYRCPNTDRRAAWIQVVVVFVLIGKLSSEHVGNFRGALTVEQGQTVYRVPIEVPRGPNNIQPVINLVYNSGGSNGLLGRGWALDILSTITRCPQTLAQDGRVRAIHYDLDDRFCLDGQRLILVQGTYGTDRSEYRTEIDSYSRIMAFGQQGSGPASFRVWTKDGRILNYGAYGVLIDDSVHQWDVAQKMDRANNEMTIEYMEKTSYPSLLTYGTAEIHFKYETRPDKSSQFFRGQILMSSIQRLNGIDVKNSQELVRKYMFEYKDNGSGGSNQSLLQQMRLCDPNGVCLRPLTFDYESDDRLLDTLPNPKGAVLNEFGNGWSIRENPRLFRDMNGDGLADIVGFYSTCVKVALNKGNGTFDESQCWVNYFGYSSGWRSANHPREVADVDGDGLPDVIGFHNEGVYVSFNTDHSLESPVLLLEDFGYSAGGWRNEHLRFVKDINGDGRADIFGFAHDGVYIALSKGRTFEAPGYWLNGQFGYDHGWRLGYHFRFLEDVSGDGLPDIVGMFSDGVYVAINSGISFSPPENWLVSYNYNNGWRIPANPRFVQDVNGDGLGDIIGFASQGVMISLSTGTSFTEKTLEVANFGYTAGAYRTENPRLVVDVSGDGLPDIIGFASNGVYVSCNKGNGTFAPPTLWVEAFGYTAGSWRAGSHPRHAEDINGDGIADLVGFASDGVHVSLNGNNRPLIRSFTDGFGVSQDISYMTLPAALLNGRYERTSDVTYPIQSPVIPTTVVQKLERNKGSGKANSTIYFYGDYKVDISGRGGLGFHQIRQQYHNNRSFVTEIHQTFPLTGQVKRVKHIVDTNGLEIPVSDVTMEYNVERAASLYTITKTSEAVTTRELDGSLVSELDVKYKGYNGYGDPLETVKHTSGAGQIYTQRTSNAYRDVVDKWLVGQLMSLTVTHESPCLGPIARVVTYQYSADTGFLLSQTLEPGHELSVTTSFEYDDFGNSISETGTPALDKGKYRRIFTAYDNNGIYKTESSNSKGHSESYEYDTFGNLIGLVGANGLRTNWTYDILGRKIGEHRSDGTHILWSYDWADTEAESGLGIYQIRMESEGSPTKTRIYDALDRVVCEASLGYGRAEVLEDILYNTEGLVHKHSFPHFVTDAMAWTVYEYDVLGREIKRDTPGAVGTTAEHRTVYKGLTVERFDALGHATYYEKDVLGRLHNIVDPLGGTVQYEYNPVGNLIQTTDAAGDTTKTEYDLFGNKISADDPNMGYWEYKHSAFGELIWQQDAKNNVLTQEYDELGRLVKRNELEGLTTWTYDTRPNGIGKVASAQQADGYQRNWFYDEDGRESKLSTVIQDKTLDITTQYDAYGRISQQTFPNGVSVLREYTEQGYLMAVGRGQAADGTDTKLVWKALAYDAAGRVQREMFGNELITNYDYDSATHLLGIETHKDGDGTSRRLKYTYDMNDNLQSRRDLIQGVSETFNYDRLDRLVQSTVSSNDGQYQWRHNWDYFSNGNVRFNDVYGLGPFEYHPTKPQAVVKAGPHTYKYDQNGNAVEKSGIKIHWSSFNKPTRFGTEGGNLDFKYAPDRNRYMKVSISGEKTIYLDKSYEVRTSDELSISKIFVYGAMGRLVAILDKNTTQDIEALVSYVHTDNLGSIDTVTDQNGQILERLNYGAFGMRRSGDWRVGNITVQSSVRGYTGHEHLDGLGLVHMNGRVYDPAIGRFLSPDPHVQDMTQTQSLNRYSYVLNNPLRHNDPTGFFFKKLKKLVKKYWKPAVAIAISIAAPYAAPALMSFGLSGLAAGALAGAAGGFASGAVLTGDIKGALKGAVGGAIMGGVGGAFGDTWNAGRVAAEATAGGVVSEIDGGEFKDGFIASGLAAGARYLYNSAVQFDVDARPGGAAVEKGYVQRPIKGVNNIGTQGQPPDSSWIDKDSFLGGNWGEGGGVSRLLNRIPGVNAVSGLHDTFQVGMDKVFFPGARENPLFNIGGMIPAAVISYAALLDGPAMAALLMDEARTEK